MQTCFLCVVLPDNMRDNGLTCRKANPQAYQSWTLINKRFLLKLEKFAHHEHIIVLLFVLASLYIGYIHVYTLCSEKNTHSHFLSVSYLHELFVDLNKKCSEYIQGLVDSNNVKIRYSFRSMT